MTARASGRVFGNYSTAFFKNDKPLWRLAVPADSPAIELPGKQLIDWGGAQRWYIADKQNKDNSYESFI